MKLVETLVDKGMGNLLKPGQITREGRAYIQLKRELLLATAQAEKEVEAIRKGELEAILSNKGIKLLPTEQAENSEPKLITHTISNSIVEDAIKKEINTSKAILHAAEELSHDAADAPNETIGDDWMFKWRNYAGEISDTDLQGLWGRLLAGELKRPGSFSLRTLEFLKNISSDEAKLIEKIARFAIMTNSIYKDENLLNKEDLKYGSLLELQEIGILSAVDSFGTEVHWVSFDKDTYRRAVRQNGTILTFEHPDPNKVASVPVYKITKIGADLVRLVSITVNLEYLENLGRVLSAQGFEVKLGDYIQTGKDQIRCINMRPITKS